LGELAAELDIPYIVDNARGTPFLGLDPRQVGASVVIYSTDKAFGGPTGGLIIGKEEFMIPIRRALGVHGNRWGTTSSHGKAGYVMVDPGKEALLGIIAALENVLKRPALLTEPVKPLFDLARAIASDELGELAESLTISSSDNSLAIEINYENTWDTDSPIPIFPIEDYYSGANLIQYGMAGAGVSPPLCYDANIIVGPLSNMCEAEGVLSEARAEFALRTMFRGIKRLTERFNRSPS
jgi:seryl-tRNA(Sec) selenium transferase